MYFRDLPHAPDGRGLQRFDVHTPADAARSPSLSLALEWDDVELDRAMLRVERSPRGNESWTADQAAKDETRPAQYHLATRGRRHVERTEAAARTSPRATAGRPTYARFQHHRGQAFKAERRDRARVRQTCAARKLPRVQFHALRHTHAPTLIRAGVDVLTISRRLGHSKAAMTLDVYGHLMEGADAAAARAIEAAMKGGQK